MGDQLLRVRQESYDELHSQDQGEVKISIAIFGLT